MPLDDEPPPAGHPGVDASRTAAEGRPIVAGFHPDPSICRFGERYVLAHSSFEYAPAIPIWTSEDLVTWTQVGNALDRASQLPFPRMTRWLDGSVLAADEGGLAPGTANTGMFAPTIRERDGRLWLVVTDVSDYFSGPLVVHADRPEGPWSDPVRIPGLVGIDPDLFWDDDGTVHLTVSSYARGGPHVMSAPVDLASGALLAPPRPLWHGTGGQAPESPHLYRRDGWYYLLLAEGGTERGHAVTVARSSSLDGPWEPDPANPILTHRGLDRPVQNVGHADLVRTRDGAWAMVYLGVLARGFSGFHVNGRETFLAGVRWIDGWPVVDEDAYPVPTVDHSFVDEFSGIALHPRWVSPGRLPESFVRPGHPGLLLSGDGGPHHMLAMRPGDDEWSAEMTVAGDGAAALTLRVDERHSMEVVVDGGRVWSEVRVGDLVSREDGPRVSPGGVTVYLRARPAEGSPLERGPDRLEAGVVVAGRHDELQSLDGRYVSVELAGGWTGRVLGPRALRGDTVVRRFSYRSDRSVIAPPLDPSPASL